MRDPNRIPKILGLLHKYWGRNPDLRLGQLVVNLTPAQHAATFNGRTIIDPYYVEDDEWEEILRKETSK